MNKQYDLQEEIDNYLLDLLSEEEKKAFEKKMSEDEDLSKEVRLNKQIANAFQMKGERSALEEMQRLSSTEELRKIIAAAERKNNPVKKSGIKKWILYVTTTAAAVLILVYIGIQPNYSSESLFYEYYTVSPFKPAPVRGDNDLIQIQQQKLYDVICMIDKDQPEAAIDSLLHFSSSPEFKLQESVQWNLALAYLKTNQREKAKNTLMEITEKDGEYTDQAQELLEKLKTKKWF